MSTLRSFIIASMQCVAKIELCVIDADSYYHIVQLYANKHITELAPRSQTAKYGMGLTRLASTHESLSIFYGGDHQFPLCQVSRAKFMVYSDLIKFSERTLAYEA